MFDTNGSFNGLNKALEAVGAEKLQDDHYWSSNPKSPGSTYYRWFLDDGGNVKFEPEDVWSDHRVRGCLVF